MPAMIIESTMEVAMINARPQESLHTRTPTTARNGPCGPGGQGTEIRWHMLCRAVPESRTSQPDVRQATNGDIGSFPEGSRENGRRFRIGMPMSVLIET